MDTCLVENITAKREVRGWMARTGRTQASLASELGVSTSFLSSVINGHKRCSLDLALRLSQLSALPVSLIAELRRERQGESVGGAAAMQQTA